MGIRLVQGERLVEFGPALAPAAQLRAGLERQTAIASAIRVNLRVHPVERLGFVAARQHASDQTLLDLSRATHRVEEQRDAGFGFDLVIQQQVPHLAAPLRISHGVLQPEFFD